MISRKGNIFRHYYINNGAYTQFKFKFYYISYYKEICFNVFGDCQNKYLICG